MDHNATPSIEVEPLEFRDVEISHEPIELYKILKFESMVGSGGEAKAIVAAGHIFLKGTSKKPVLFRDVGVSCVLTAFGAHKLGALLTVRPHVFAHTFRFSARGFLALTKNAGFLEMPSMRKLKLKSERKSWTVIL